MECIYLTSPNEKLIYLKNVSTISIDRNNFKIIYNFVNSINIVGRETPDYSYQKFNSLEEMLEEFEKIKSLDYIKDNFLISEVPENYDEIVNKNFITSISVIEDKRRLVFNLNYSISIIDKKSGKPMKISKFVYFDYPSKKRMKSEVGKFVEKIFMH